MNVETELTRLWQRDGLLTPAQVLLEATDPESPLHGRFDWDDTSAAAKWRLEQARGLIRSCRIIVETKPDTWHRIRSFVSTPESYVPVADALGDAPTRDLVLQQALRDIRQLKMKYSSLLDFSQALAAFAAQEQAA